MLLGAAIPLLTIAKLGLPYKASDLVAVVLLSAALPLGLWGFNWFMRKSYNEGVRFLSDFLAAKLNTRPIAGEASLESMEITPPLPRASIEILVLILVIALTQLIGVILSQIFGNILLWFPSRYTPIILLTAVLIGSSFGCAIFVLLHDPAIRKKAPTHNSEQIED